VKCSQKLLAMQLAAAVYLHRKRTVYCAEYHHYNRHRCIFNCRFPELLAREDAMAPVAGGIDASSSKSLATSPPGSPSPGCNRESAMRKRLSLALLIISFSGIAANNATSVEAIGMTVRDMDRAVEFYSALTFQKVSDVEVLGDDFEDLEGVFGARRRIVRMRLGNEYLDLTQYLAPPGRPIPVDSRSNDLWFQHIAIVVRDMD
jgi:hypothetical protein